MIRSLADTHILSLKLTFWYFAAPENGCFLENNCFFPFGGFKGPIFPGRLLLSIRRCKHWRWQKTAPTQVCMMITICSYLPLGYFWNEIRWHDVNGMIWLYVYILVYAGYRWVDGMEGCFFWLKCCSRDLILLSSGSLIGGNSAKMLKQTLQKRVLIRGIHWNTVDGLGLLPATVTCLSESQKVWYFTSSWLWISLGFVFLIGKLQSPKIVGPTPIPLP